MAFAQTKKVWDKKLKCYGCSDPRSLDNCLKLTKEVNKTIIATKWQEGVDMRAEQDHGVAHVAVYKMEKPEEGHGDDGLPSCD